MSTASKWDPNPSKTEQNCNAQDSKRSREELWQQDVNTPVRKGTSSCTDGHQVPAKSLCPRPALFSISCVAGMFAGWIGEAALSTLPWLWGSSCCWGSASSEVCVGATSQTLLLKLQSWAQAAQRRLAWVKALKFPKQPQMTLTPNQKFCIYQTQDEVWISSSACRRNLLWVAARCCALSRASQARQRSWELKENAPHKVSGAGRGSLFSF